MSFKINIDERRIRSVIAKIDDEGTEKEMPVEYYAWTIAETRQYEDAVKKSVEEKKTFFLSELLVKRIHSLPTVVDKSGKPIKITAQNVEKIPLDVLQAINAAIEEDQVPKQRPQK